MASPSVTMLTGPLLLGFLFNYALFGILILQVYNYSSKFPNDPRITYSFVYAVFIADIIQIILSTHLAWYTFGSGWGDPTHLEVAPWSLTSIPPSDGLVSVLVQLFFARRVWLLDGRKNIQSLIIPGIIVIVALVQCSFSVATAIIFSRHQFYSKIILTHSEVMLWLGGSALCDVLITVTLVRQLWTKFRGRNFKRTDHIIHRAIQLTVETGAITAFAATVELILFFVLQDTTWHLFLGILLGKLYSNSLMTNLNSRQTNRKGHFLPTSIESGLDRPTLDGHFPLAPRNTVHITTIKTVNADSDSEDTGVRHVAQGRVSYAKNSNDDGDILKATLEP